MFIGLEQFTETFSFNEFGSFFNIFVGANQPLVYEKKNISMRERYDEFYERDSPSLYYSTDFGIEGNIPVFNCIATNCYSLQLQMDEFFSDFKQQATFDIASLFGVIASFGGLHSVMSLVVSTIVLLYLRVWFCVAGHKVASIVNRPTSSIEILENALKK
jgi:hypothetical protein